MAETLEYPRYSHAINLQAAGITEVLNTDLYTLVLAYLQNLWQNEVQLTATTAPPEMGEPLMPFSIHSYSYVTFNGLRYGSGMKHGGQAYHHGYIQGCQPVQIALILYINHIRRDKPNLSHTCAVVQRYMQDSDTPSMPWDLQ
jgi:hypothetical protein